MKMIRFNKESKNIREQLNPAMEITTQEEADLYLEDYIQFLMTHDLEYLDSLHKMCPNESEEYINSALRIECERVAKSNLGYFAGYLSNEKRAIVEKLFNCAHPIFGAIVGTGAPTPSEAYECGRLNITLAEYRSLNNK